MASMLTWFGILTLLTRTVESTKADTNQASNDPLEQDFGTIQHGSVIFRHGDRSPLVAYPLDPHKNYRWLQGFGQLTSRGKRRMYDLGKWFRRRYTKLIDQNYNREQLIVHSKDSDRCIMSAQCLLHGLYPGNSSHMWREDDQWLPIPVHSIPEKNDNVIHVSRECPAIKQIIEASYASTEVQNVFKKYADTIQFIEKYSGINFNNITSVSVARKLRQLATTLEIENQNNLSLPDWTKQIHPEPLKTIVRETIHLEVYHPVGKRLTVGPILKSIRSDMLKKVDNATFSQNLHLYSSSDTLLESVMIALNVYNHIRPQFGSALIFELRKKGNENLVTISYKNSTEELFLLNIPARTLQEFLDLIDPILPRDWNEECERLSSFSVKVVPNHCCFILITIIYIKYFIK